jgi:L,D-transpeptidase catalytic domain
VPYFRTLASARYVRAIFIAVPLIFVANEVSGARDTVPGKTSVATVSAKTPVGTSVWSHAAIGTIDPRVFDLALGAARCAVRSGAITEPTTLTVIDYSKPSTEKRLWVFDLQTRELLYEELVAHGQGSGDNLANVFSNQPDTHASSLGLFLTDDTYVGRNGYSLRLTGLDEGFNHRARERAIVMHGAPYVSEDFVKKNGRLGRSWGCPALREGVAREVIDRVRGGGILFAYYPDQDWLESSRYLGDCAASTRAGS